MNEYMKIIKQQEFRKQTEEAKFEAFSAMCEKVADLEKKNAELKETVIKMNNVITETFSNLTKAREILCSMLSQYRDRKEIDYSTRECGEKLLKEGVCKNG